MWKIGFVSHHSFLKPGGVRAHILSLKDEFRKKGILAKIIIPRRKKSEKYPSDIIFLGKSIPFLFEGTEADFSFALNFRKISKTLKKEKFDVLHFHNFGLLSFQILKKSNSLNILTIHTAYGKNKFFKGDPFSQLKFKGKDKILKKFSFLTTDYLIEEIQKRIDGVIVVSPFVLTLCQGYFGPKIVIPNGINLKRFNQKAKKIKKFKDKNFLNVLFLGRLEERKGLIYLLKAWQILEKKFKDKNLRLIIGGDGDLKTKYKKFVKTKNLKNVIFEGMIPSALVPSYYATADIFVSPAIFGESFGIVLLEAMASGTPVVAFANEGYKTVIKGKYKSFLAEPKDFKGLAKKIEILIKNKEKRKEMRSFGLKLAKEYSWPKIADKVLDFYHFCQKNKKDKKTRHRKRDYLKRIGGKLKKEIINTFESF